MPRKSFALILLLNTLPKLCFAYHFDPALHPEFSDRGGIYYYLSSPEFIPDRELGFIHNNKPFRFTVTTKEKLVWDVTESFDQDSFRITPQDHLEKRKDFLAFFGCSFTVGTGVNDDETFPYHLATTMKDWHVYNLGIGASAPNMMLALLQSDRLKKKIKENSGIFVYMGGGHLQRANGFYMESEWMRDTPFYEKDKSGHLVRNGSFDTANPRRLAIYDFVRSLQKNLFPQFHFNWPRISKSHIDYSCDLIAAAVAEAKKLNKNAKLLVFSHPLYPIEPEVIRCLRARSISVLEHPLSYIAPTDLYMDGHPTASFNKKFAAILAKDLEPYLSPR